jgi:hypothetical protein
MNSEPMRFAPWHPTPSGYEVALLVEPKSFYTVCLATWHMEFTDEDSAIGTFLAGLSEFYRLEVASRGNVDYRWTIQSRDGDGWRNGSTVSLIRLTGRGGRSDICKIACSRSRKRKGSRLTPSPGHTGVLIMVSLL